LAVRQAGDAERACHAVAVGILTALNCFIYQAAPEHEAYA
jgi:hypothetical protein